MHRAQHDAPVLPSSQALARDLADLGQVRLPHRSILDHEPQHRQTHTDIGVLPGINGLKYGGQCDRAKVGQRVCGNGAVLHDTHQERNGSRIPKPGYRMHVVEHILARLVPLAWAVRLSSHLCPSGLDDGCPKLRSRTRAQSRRLNQSAVTHCWVIRRERLHHFSLGHVRDLSLTSCGNRQCKNTYGHRKTTSTSLHYCFSNQCGTSHHSSATIRHSQTPLLPRKHSRPNRLPRSRERRNLLRYPPCVDWQACHPPSRCRQDSANWIQPTRH